MGIKDFALYLLFVLAILILLIAIVSCIQTLYKMLIVNPKREREVEQNVDEIMMEMLLKEMEKAEKETSNDKVTQDE